MARPVPTSFLEVFALDRSLARLLGLALRDSPLTPLEYGVYSVIASHEEPTVTLIAERLSVPLTTASDWIQSAISRDHVARTRSNLDGRRFRLELTSAGLNAYKETSDDFGKAFERFRTHSPIDEDNLLRTLGGMRTAIDAASEELAKQR